MTDPRHDGALDLDPEAQAIADAVRPYWPSPDDALHEWRCPNCGAITRARMADQ